MDYDKDNRNTQQTSSAQPQEPIDLFAAALSFIGLNLMWVFFAGWMLFGMVPVLIFALFLNHLIDRLEDHLQHPET
ncbi:MULTISPECIES: histidinol phosphate aminotransferase [unclassified Pseudophaeobacter]|uniref:histidinol phosphate aminotransferase n=1 Tax=unclassified Pseudophaeobacter TaxID=2637024 RepID=UPI000EFC701D|nr:histidinol phosphate aminotransferase [Pseudophaeobacter sp. EL27]